METAILKVHLFSSFALTGIIWLVQVVHYPSFRFVEEETYPEFQRFHVSRIPRIVAPLMIIEALTGIILLVRGIHFPDYVLWINIICIIGIWLTTGFINNPKHEKLAAGKDLNVIHALILSNWPRTVLWSGKSLLLFFYWDPS